jgi:protein O-GlcNAc transferase
MFDKDRYHHWDYAHELPPGSAAANGHAAAASSSSIPPAVATRRPLRIGYLSADFFTHSVSYFIEAPLAFADPTRTHITCYSNVARRDKKTAHLQTLAHAWRPVHELSAKQVAEMMRIDRIDILVELTGHTAGNRLDVLALKPAPIACTWIGYPNSTGLPTIDYRLTDAIVDPPSTRQQYSEELIRLDGPFLCYTPPSEAPPVAPTPALSKGYVTFGSFNNLAKVNDAVLQAWCRILLAVPHSRMLIKCKPFASPTVCGKMWARFAELGVESDRVDLVSLLPTTSEHLDSYSNVDISVDTFPYAGTTTTCEALYCGVPVVTYQRVQAPNHAHNVGATLLRRIKGMEKLVAQSEEEVSGTRQQHLSCCSLLHISPLLPSLCWVIFVLSVCEHRRCSRSGHSCPASHARCAPPRHAGFTNLPWKDFRSETDRDLREAVGEIRQRREATTIQ